MNKKDALRSRKLALAALLVGVTAPRLSRADGPRGDVVAVYDIEGRPGADLSAADAEAATDSLISEVTAAGMATVPRAQIRDRLREETVASYKACHDESCQIEIGKALSAQKYVSSIWARLGTAGCTLTVTIYDLRREVSEYSTKADGACSAGGLKAAIELIGQSLRARRQHDYGSFLLDLDEGRAIKNPPTDKKGYLKIDAQARRGTSTEKIEVYINGEPRPFPGSGLFVAELPVGRYVVLLRAAGGLFAPKRLDVEMTAAGVRIPAAGPPLQLTPIFGTLKISGTPNRATAIINGEPRPIEGTLAEDRRAGKYTVIVEAAGYLPSPPLEVEVPAGGEREVPYELQRNAGTLEVTGAPGGAAVLVDEVPRGAVPLRLSDVDIGDHVVEVRAPGYRLERRVASVRRSETTSVDVHLGQKLARLKVEAVARGVGDAVPVEADVILDGLKVGATPWKGEVLAEVPHELKLRLGKQEGPSRSLLLPEGQEQREVIDVPASWGGAVSSVRFQLVPGPWALLSGATVLKEDGENLVRPGRVPVELFLEGKKVGRVQLEISPEERRTVIVTARPLTDSELASDRGAWAIRRWASLAGALAAGAICTERMLAERRAADERDAALAALGSANTAESFDGLRAEVIDAEHSRRTAKIIGISALGAASALAVWSFVEWVAGEPARGRLEGDGVVEVAE